MVILELDREDEIEIGGPDETLESPQYLGIVLAAAIRIVLRERWITGCALATSMRVPRQTFYRWMRGGEISRTRFEFAIFHLEKFLCQAI